jgi:hypothetical protein
MFCTTVQNMEESKTKEPEFTSPSAKFIQHTIAVTVIGNCLAKEWDC